MAGKPKGVSVNVWIDGVDSANDCTLCQCDHIDTQWQCPFAMGYVSPMEPSTLCTFKEGGDCHSVHARLDGLNELPLHEILFVFRAADLDAVRNKPLGKDAGLDGAL